MALSHAERYQNRVDKLVRIESQLVMFEESGHMPWI
jgi:hypothetical protein